MCFGNEFNVKILFEVILYFVFLMVGIFGWLFVVIKMWFVVINLVELFV